jgi:hypothetical protein
MSGSARDGAQDTQKRTADREENPRWRVVVHSRQVAGAEGEPKMERWMPTILAVLVLLAGAFLFRPAATPGAEGGHAVTDPPTLEIYSVAPTQSAVLRRELTAVLGDRGQVSQPAPDQLMVLAPEHLQTQIGAVLQGMPLEAPAAIAATPVHFEAWVVDVDPAAPEDPRLAPVASALTPFRESMGARAFRLVTQLGTTLTPNDWDNHRVQDRRADLGLRLSAVEGGVDAELRFHANPMSMTTKTRLRFGETVVLAQAGAVGDLEQSGTLRLLIVRVTPLD